MGSVKKKKSKTKENKKDSHPHEIFINALDKMDIVDKDYKKRYRPEKQAPKKEKPKGKIDLHGRSLAESINIIQNLLNNYKSFDFGELVIITGKGTHSDFLYPVLKTGIEEYLKENMDKYHLKYTIMEAGFKVWLED